MDRKAELETAEEKGIQKGIQKEKLETAKRMKNKNISIDEIAEITGLTKEQIQKI